LMSLSNFLNLYLNFLSWQKLRACVINLDFCVLLPEQFANVICQGGEERNTEHVSFRTKT